MCRLVRNPPRPTSLRLDSPDGHRHRTTLRADWLDAGTPTTSKRLLRHFGDEVIFTSPLAIRSSKVPTASSAAKSNCARIGARVASEPELHFEVESLYLGVNSIVIHYRNHFRWAGQRGARLRGALVSRTRHVLSSLTSRGSLALAWKAALPGCSACAEFALIIRHDSSTATN